jgi:hypothetical protein
VREAEKDLKKRARSLGGMADAWDAVVPRTLAARCRLQTFSRGVLTVRAADASARFELDRFLRAGGEAALARRGSAALKRLKIVI